MPHSGLGIVSLILGGVGALFELALAFAARTESASGTATVDNSPALATIVGAMVIGLLINLIGLGTGVASLFQRDRKRMVGTFGVIVNACVLLAAAGVFAFGIGWGA
ncbi:MAG: hypothetical protein ACYC7A_06075 [Thermoanaerobaculia bacterium]